MVAGVAVTRRARITKTEFGVPEDVHVVDMLDERFHREEELPEWVVRVSRRRPRGRREIANPDLFHAYDIEVAG